MKLVEGGLYGPCERFRKGKGWSQSRLAGKADVSVECVRELEHGHYAKLTVEKLIAIASALGLSACDLVPGLSVRITLPNRGNRANPGVKRKGEKQRSEVRDRLVQVLRANGRMKTMDLCRAMFEEFGCSEQQVRRARTELKIESVRIPGMGNGRASWYVELPDSLKDAG